MASACAAGSYPETGLVPRCLRCAHARSRPVVSGKVSLSQSPEGMRCECAACHARMGGRTRWLLVRDVPIPVGFRLSQFAAAVSAAQARSDAVSQASVPTVPSGNEMEMPWLVVEMLVLF